MVLCHSSTPAASPCAGGGERDPTSGRPTAQAAHRAFYARRPLHFVLFVTNVADVTTMRNDHAEEIRGVSPDSAKDA